MYALRDEYAVTLSQEESDQIDIKLSNYYTETNGELLSKIGISKSRLKKVFEKKEIADKVENLMSFNDKKCIKSGKVTILLRQKCSGKIFHLNTIFLRQMIYIRSESNAGGISTIVDKKLIPRLSMLNNLYEFLLL